MSITIRPTDPTTDFPGIARLLTALDPGQPTTAEHLQEDERQRPEGMIMHRLVALNDAGEIISSAGVYWAPWQRPGRFWLSLKVAAEWRRQSIGGQLYADLAEFTKQNGVTRIECSVKDTDPDSRGFAERRGFQMDRHLFESTLNLASFDETPFAGAIAAAEATGIRFLALADVGVCKATMRQLYDLEHGVCTDIPGWDDNAFPPFDEYYKFITESHWFRPDTQIIAADGDRWVGMAALGYHQENNSMYHNITGVDRNYRGRHLALALKLVAIRAARRYGVAYVRTNNDSENGPMLAINRKLGYRPEPGWYKMVKE